MVLLCSKFISNLQFVIIELIFAIDLKWLCYIAKHWLLATDLEVLFWKYFNRKRYSHFSRESLHGNQKGLNIYLADGWSSLSARKDLALLVDYATPWVFLDVPVPYFSPNVLSPTSFWAATCCQMIFFSWKMFTFFPI